MGDSGASVTIAPNRFISRLDLVRIKLKYPIVVEFGDQGKHTAYEYAESNSVIGKILIFPDNLVNQFIISIPSIIKSKHLVLFDEDHVYLLNNKLQLVATGNRNFINQLYYFNVYDLLAIPFNTSSIDNKNISINTIEITQKIVRLYIDEHERLNHISAERHIESIRNGALINSTVTIAQIRKNLPTYTLQSL